MSSSVALGLDVAHQVLAAQPFSQLLGARVTRWDDDGVVIEIPVRKELGQHLGFVHGGVLAYSADVALTFAAGRALASPSVVTAGFDIEYLRPATGSVVRAVGAVVRAGRTRVVCRADVFTVDDDGEPALCAVAQGSASVFVDRA